MRQGTVLLKTNRLILRKFKEDDLDAFFTNWASNDNVTKYLSWPTHKDKSITKIILDSWLKDYQDGAYNWAIQLLENDELIGNISVVKDDYQNKTCEIGYCIGEAYWNKGYTTEALKKVIEYLFLEGYEMIVAKHDINNLSSGRVMQKAGMIFKERQLKCTINNQGLADCDVYYIKRGK